MEIRVMAMREWETASLLILHWALVGSKGNIEGIGVAARRNYEDLPSILVQSYQTKEDRRTAP